MKCIGRKLKVQEKKKVGPFLGLCRDRDFSVSIESSDSMSRQWVLCCDRIWPKAGISCHDRVLHVVTMP